MRESLYRSQKALLALPRVQDWKTQCELNCLCIEKALELLQSDQAKSYIFSDTYDFINPFYQKSHTFLALNDVKKSLNGLITKSVAHFKTQGKSPKELIALCALQLKLCKSDAPCFSIETRESDRAFYKKAKKLHNKLTKEATKIVSETPQAKEFSPKNPVNQALSKKLKETEKALQQRDLTKKLILRQKEEKAKVIETRKLEEAQRLKKEETEKQEKIAAEKLQLERTKKAAAKAAEEARVAKINAEIAAKKERNRIFTAAQQKQAEESKRIAFEKRQAAEAKVSAAKTQEEERKKLAILKKAEELKKVEDTRKAEQSKLEAIETARLKALQLAEQKALEDAKAAKQELEEFTFSLIPENVIKTLVKLNETLTLEHSTQLMLYGSTIIAMGFAEAHARNPSASPIPFKTIVVNDTDLSISYGKDKPFSGLSPVESTVCQMTVQDSLGRKQPLFKLKPGRDYPIYFTNYLSNEGKLELTVGYPGYQSASSDLIPLSAIKAYFAAQKDPALPSICLGTNLYLIINDQKNILEQTYHSGIYDYCLPAPGDEQTGIFARAFGFYFKMNGILQPGPNVNKIIDCKEANWAYYYFSQMFFGDKQKEFKLRQSCHKEMDQLIRKDLFKKPELTATITALCHMFLLEDKPSETIMKLIEFGTEKTSAALSNACRSSLNHAKVEKMVVFLQNYFSTGKEISFYDAVSLITKYPSFLEKPKEALTAQLDQFTKPVSLVNMEQLQESGQITDAKNATTVRNFCEKYLLTMFSEKNIPQDSILTYAKKMAEDLQWYYTIIPTFQPALPLRYILDNLQPYLLSDKFKDTNFVLKIPSFGGSIGFHELPVHNIVGVLRNNHLPYSAIKPFLENYCNVMLNRHVSGDLSSQQRSFFAALLYEYYKKVPPQELHTLYDFFLKLLPCIDALQNIETVEKAVEVFVAPKVKDYQQTQKTFLFPRPQQTYVPRHSGVRDLKIVTGHYPSFEASHAMVGGLRHYSPSMPRVSHHIPQTRSSYFRGRGGRGRGRDRFFSPQPPQTAPPVRGTSAPSQNASESSSTLKKSIKQNINT